MCAKLPSQSIIWTPSLLYLSSSCQASGALVDANIGVVAACAAHSNQHLQSKHNFVVSSIPSNFTQIRAFIGFPIYFVILY